MTAVALPIEATNLMVIPSDASVETLCSLLIECEKAQHRYQWASGLVLVTLMDKPDAPKTPYEFAEWLTPKTGMVLTQNEIKRRVIVYRFYSPFADAQIIDLIERGGIRLAFHARKAIDPKAPTQARAVLQACIDNPGATDETLRRLTTPRPSRSGKSAAAKAPAKGKTRKIKQLALDEVRDKLTRDAQEFGEREWVPLATVLELLDTLGALNPSLAIAHTSTRRRSPPASPQSEGRRVG